MSQDKINVTLPDGTVLDLPSGSTAGDVAAAIGPGLAKAALGAEIDGELVGTAMGGWDGHRGWVYSVVVSPEHRREGVGTALMKRVERDLAFMGCHKLNLQVRGSNREAVEFYKSLGYSTEDRVSMGKRLEEDLG